MLALGPVTPSESRLLVESAPRVDPHTEVTPGAFGLFVGAALVSPRIDPHATFASSRVSRPDVGSAAFVSPGIDDHANIIQEGPEPRSQARGDRLSVGPPGNVHGRCGRGSQNQKQQEGKEPRSTHKEAPFEMAATPATIGGVAAHQIMVPRIG